MKTKIQRVFVTVAVILAAVTLTGIIAALAKKKKDEPAAVYTVSYAAIENGRVTSIYAPLFKKDGTYPASYVEGETFTVSDLNGRTTRTPVPECWGWDGAYVSTGEFTDPYNANRTFEFLGWFLDGECLVPFDSAASADLHGDIVLYAKISVGIWTSFY